jgi:hypothetical protein
VAEKAARSGDTEMTRRQISLAQKGILALTKTDKINSYTSRRLVEDLLRDMCETDKGWGSKKDEAEKLLSSLGKA